MARPKIPSVPEASSQSVAKGLRKSSSNTPAPEMMAELENEISMESEQEIEAEGATLTPRSPRKRVVDTGTRNSSSQDQEQDGGDNITVAPHISQPKKRGKPMLSFKPLGEFQRVVLKNETDYDDFLSKTKASQAYIRDMKTLEVHLDAGKLTAYTEDRFALALKELHPRPNDGTSPHDLKAILLVVKGTLLLTRYSYHLVSPVLSSFVGDRLKKLADGKLTDKEKKDLPYMINSTEKLLADALLGIRGVKQVSIEGKGTMEADFAATIQATLIQPPGTDILEASDKESQFSTLVLNKLGPISSVAYINIKQRQLPYPTVPGKLEYDFSRLPAKKRFIVDEKTELSGRLEGLDDRDARAAAVVEQHGPRSRASMPKYEVGLALKTSLRMCETMAEQIEEITIPEVKPIAKPSLWTRRTTAKQTEEVEKTDENDDSEGASLGLMEMVRINKRNVRPGDIDAATLDAAVLLVVLTAKEEAVELGWKV